MTVSARALLAVLVVALVAACSPGLLGDAEREWCAANPAAVLDAFGTEYAGRAVVNDFADAYIAATREGPEDIGSFFRDNFTPEYERSCRIAYAGR